jgi:hypothetical protein
MCRKTPRKDLTAEYVRSLLKYYPETGEFEWKIKRPGKKKGIFKGCLAPTGYYQIGIDKKVYYAHRLAWLIATGSWPDKLIDHINRNPKDNRLENLRESTHSENHKNGNTRADNKSGHRGVCWSSRRNRWHVQLVAHKKRIYSGYFADLEDAVAARKAAEKKYFGEFAPC